jgi:L-threonylcarbamoyladenylate synthase
MSDTWRIMRHMLVRKIVGDGIDTALLAEAAAVVRAGGVVVFPTETAYGLAADPHRTAAVRKIFAIKGRQETKPLPLIAADVAAVRRAFVIDNAMRSLAKRWPAPLTLVLPRRAGQHLPALLGRRDGAVRMPAHTWARALAAACGGLITATSANLSGEANLYSGTAVQRTFRNRAVQPDLTLDAGRLPSRQPSTIVAMRRGKLVMLRQGEFRLSLE